MLSLSRFLACSCMVVQLTFAADFYLQCNPYTSGGQQRVGAFGVCQNDCFAVHKGGKPGTLNRAAGRLLLSFYPVSAGGDTDLCAKVPHGRPRMQLTSDAYASAPCRAGRGGNSPCSTGNSPYANGGTCDEYPYASTTQGGASGNPAVLRCIPSGENSSGGAELTNFFNANNVAVGASFRVGIVYDPYVIIPFPPVTFCSHEAAAPFDRNNAPSFCANTGMNNDGTEFHYVNGALSNARRVRREFDLLEDATTPAWASGPAPVFPIFKTSRGDHAILFDENAKVGDPVWSDVLTLPGALDGVVGGYFLQEHVGWSNGTTVA